MANWTLKTCIRCIESKPIEEFGKKEGGKYKDSYCLSCRRIYGAEHYQKNKSICQERKKDRIKKNRIIILEYLATHPCIDCGEGDCVVLQFDHVRGKKKADVCKMAHNGVGSETLLDEIAKCDIRCANDHMRKTMKANKCWRVI